MTDLIERLRADDLLPADMEFLVEEAADEIERLKVELKEAEVHWYNEGKRVSKRSMQPVVDAAREALIALRACCPPKLNPARITLGKALNTLDKGKDDD